MNLSIPLAVAIGALTAIVIYFYFPGQGSRSGPPDINVATIEKGLSEDPLDHGKRLELARYYLQWGLVLSRGKAPLEENMSDSGLVDYFEDELDEWEKLGQDVAKYRQMLRSDPDGFRDLFVREERLLSKQMFERSVILFRQTRALGGVLSTRDLFDLGTAYYHMGVEGYDGASRFFGEAVEKGLVSARVLTFLGNVAIAREDYGKGIELYKQALEQSEADPILTFNLALAYKEKGEYEPAITHLRETLKYYQNKVNLVEEELTIILQSRLALGWCLLKQGRHGEAVTQFETLLDAQPDMADGHYWLGVAYHGMGRADLARAHWQRVERVEPGFRDVRQRLQSLAQPPPRR